MEPYDQRMLLPRRVVAKKTRSSRVMMADELCGVHEIDRVLDDFFAERVTRSAIMGSAYQRLWDRIRTSSAGGKRLRPRLLLLAYDSLVDETPGAPVSEAARPDAAATAGRGDALIAAAAFELLHTALLLHDDVLDGDLVRRARPNLLGAFVGDALDAGIPGDRATAWGDAAGILAGDLLLSALHALIARMTGTHRAAVHDLVDECLFATAAGEFADVGFALGTVRAGTADITRMMHDKTAAYSFAAPLRAGALLAGAGLESESALRRIGSMLGFVYQLCDDILGVFGQEDVLGKSVDGDLREGKRTLLIAYAEGSDEWADVQHLFGRRTIDEEDTQRLRDALTASGARQRTELLLARRCEEVRRRIDEAPLPEQLRAELREIAQHCAARTA